MELNVDADKQFKTNSNRWRKMYRKSFRVSIAPCNKILASLRRECPSEDNSTKAIITKVEPHLDLRLSWVQTLSMPPTRNGEHFLHSIRVPLILAAIKGPVYHHLLSETRDSHLVSHPLNISMSQASKGRACCPL